jgi:ankyrin repeat protein
MKRIDRSLDVGLLITAVRRDDPTAAASALDAGADPDTCAEGYPLLCLAAASGHRKVVELLLRAGASPHLLDAHMGASALHKAAQSGVVLAHGAFIDLQAPTHGTARGITRQRSHPYVRRAETMAASMHPIICRAYLPDTGTSVLSSMAAAIARHSRITPFCIHCGS